MRYEGRTTYRAVDPSGCEHRRCTRSMRFTHALLGRHPDPDEHGGAEWSPIRWSQSLEAAQRAQRDLSRVTTIIAECDIVPL